MVVGLNAGQSVKNMDAFQVLEQVFLRVSLFGHCTECKITLDHMQITWGSHADHMESHADHIRVTCRSHGGHMQITQGHMQITWGSHADHTGSLMSQNLLGKLGDS